MADRGDLTRDLLLLTLLLALWFGFKLGERSLWSPDEGRYSEIPREMVVTGDYITPRLNGVKYFEKPPFFYWLQSVSIKLFGLNEWSLRFWTAALAYLGCLAVYLAGRAMYGRGAGLMGVVVMATSPLYYAMGRIITLDMAVSVLLTCALLAFLLGLREPPGVRRRAAMWGFFVFAALATLTKGLIGFVIPGLIIGVWILLLGEWRVLREMYLPSGLMLFAAIVLPWHVLIARANPEFLSFYIIHEHFRRYLAKQHGSLHQVWVFVPVLLFGLFPWSVFLLQAIRHSVPSSWSQRKHHKEALFLILWAALVLLFFSASSSKLIPYILPMFPPLAILIGRYFSAIWEKGNWAEIRSGCWAFVMASFLLAAVGLVLAPRVAGYSDPVRFAAYTYAVAAVLALGSLAMLLLARHVGFPRAFLSMTATGAAMLLVTNSGLLLFDHSHSVKSIATALKPRLLPGDVVASYHAYYQDLPVYLQRRVAVVGWKGELSFGAQAEDVSSWIMDDAVLWEKWRGPATIYILMNRGRYEELRSRSERKFYPVMQTDFYVLVSNKVGSTDRRQGMGGRDRGASRFSLVSGGGIERGEESI